MMREFRRDPRCPVAPAARRRDPIEQACPMHIVETSGLMYLVGERDRLSRQLFMS